MHALLYDSSMMKSRIDAEAYHRPRSSSRKRSEQRLATEAAAKAASSHSRRRKMAFLKYGSSSSDRMHREHARKLAMSVQNDSPALIQSSSTFADFGAAFPDNNHVIKMSHSSAADESFHSENSFFEEDPFARGSRTAAASKTNSSRSRTRTTTHQPPQEKTFETDWPSTDDNMFSMPSNSSMQSKFPRQQEPSSPDPSNDSVLARRRTRSKMRSKDKQQRDFSSPVATPPQSPHSHSSNGKRYPEGRSRNANHVVNYSTPTSQPYRSTPNSAARSVGSSTSGSEPNLFDNDGAGFTFDAFGLDATQINHQVSAAMHDMDEFKSNWEEESSRASTPEVGFVDGFRVSSSSKPVMSIRQSPTSTERSSLTSDEGEASKGSRNVFKEQAGFQSSHRRVSERKPQHYSMNKSPLRKRMHAGNMPKIPILDNSDNKHSLASPRSKPDVEFFDENSSQESAVAAVSDAGAASDAAVSSDVGGALSDAGVDPRAPVRTMIPKSTGDSDTCPTESTAASSTLMEEKKEDDGWPVRDSPSRRRKRAPLQPKSQISRLQQQAEDALSSPDRLLTRSSPRNDSSSRAARSEMGTSSVQASHVNAMLRTMNQRSSETKSETGAAYFGVKLRQSSQPPPEPVVPPVEEHMTSVEEHATPVEGHSTNKLTYRERRELELQNQQPEPPKPPERDVASLVRQRIAAANKQQQEVVPDLPQSESFTDRRNNLKHVSTRDEPQERSRFVATENEQPKSSTTQRTDRLPATKRSNPIETDPPNGLPFSGQVAEKSGPTESTDAICQSHSEEQLRSNKGSTPKATMMMLNAFLAGRESIASGGDGASTGATTNASPEGKAADAVEPAATENTPGVPALKEDPTYKRYFKMLSVGMPMEVVKHAMERDGLDPSVMDGDHSKPVGVPLRLDPTYSKYFKMLSIGLPMEAVKHAMARDGLDPAVMDQDHNLPVASGVKHVEKTEKEKDSHRRARMHWTTLRKVTSNSLWAKIDEDDALTNIDIDEAEFRELFEAERNAASTPKKRVAAAAKKGATVRVIDPKRANNGGIILARLKMSHDEMADAVDRINDSALNAEQIEQMIEYLPSKEERKALESYMLEGGQDAAEKFEGLCECEKFMVSMMTVKHAKRKVRALLFKLQFESCVHDIQKDAFLVEGACEELVNSVRLRQLLGFILEFGNRLNTAGKGKTQKAGAFTIDSLSKLRLAKAFDKKTTFLNFVVRMVQRNNEILLNFKDDLPTVFKADKVFWDQCVTDLEEVENQLENVRRISLYQARHTVSFRPRRKNKNREDEEESLSDSEISLTLEEEVEALRATPIGLFTLSAIKYISAVRNKVEDTKRKYWNVLEYFGDEDKNRQPHDLFNIIVSFSNDFDKEKEQVATNQKRKLREERKRQASLSKKGRNQVGKPPPYSPAPSDRGLLRASNHQPNIGSVLNEMGSCSPPRETAVDHDEPPPVQSAVSRLSSRAGRLALSPRGRPSPHAEVESASGSHAGTSSKGSALDEPSPARTASSKASSTAALRHRARLQQQRYGNVRSHTTGRALKESQAPSARSDSADITRDVVPSESAELRPSQSDESSKSATMEARSNFRNRRRLEQRRLRQETAAAGNP